MSTTTSTSAADILDTVILKDPIIWSNAARLDAANEYINRIRLAVSDVKALINKSIQDLSGPEMSDLRDKFLKSNMKVCGTQAGSTRELDIRAYPLKAPGVQSSSKLT